MKKLADSVHAGKGDCQHIVGDAKYSISVFTWVQLVGSKVKQVQQCHFLISWLLGVGHVTYSGTEQMPAMHNQSANGAATVGILVMGDGGGCVKN